MPDLFTILQKIPWKKALTFTPLIYEAGKEFFDSMGRQSHHQAQPEQNGGRKEIDPLLAEIRGRLDSFDTSLHEQASLLSQLTEQTVELNNRLQFLTDRVTVVLFLTIGTFIAVSVVLIKMFMR